MNYRWKSSKKVDSSGLNSQIMHISSNNLVYCRRKALNSWMCFHRRSLILNSQMFACYILRVNHATFFEFIYVFLMIHGRRKDMSCSLFEWQHWMTSYYLKVAGIFMALAYNVNLSLKRPRLLNVVAVEFFITLCHKIPGLKHELREAHSIIPQAS